MNDLEQLTINTFAEPQFCPVETEAMFSWPLKSLLIRQFREELLDHQTWLKIVVPETTDRILSAVAKLVPHTIPELDEKYTKGVDRGDHTVFGFIAGCMGRGKEWGGRNPSRFEVSNLFQHRFTREEIEQLSPDVKSIIEAIFNGPYNNDTIIPVPTNFDPDAVLPQMIKAIMEQTQQSEDFIQDPNGTIRYVSADIKNIYKGIPMSIRQDMVRDGVWMVTVTCGNEAPKPHFTNYLIFMDETMPLDNDFRLGTHMSDFENMTHLLTRRQTTGQICVVDTPISFIKSRHMTVEPDEIPVPKYQSISQALVAAHRMIIHALYHNVRPGSPAPALESLINPSTINAFRDELRRLIKEGDTPADAWHEIEPALGFIVNMTMDFETATRLYVALGILGGVLAPELGSLKPDYQWQKESIAREIINTVNWQPPRTVPGVFPEYPDMFPYLELNETGPVLVLSAVQQILQKQGRGLNLAPDIVSAIRFAQIKKS